MSETGPMTPDRLAAIAGREHAATAGPENARNLAADIACQEAADVRTEQAEARVATLVLSLFPGIGLMDMAFEEEGFCVVRGPDLLWGGDVRRFHPPAGVFAGVIGGPPCQAFSQANVMGRLGRQHLASNLIPEFERVVAEATPRWFLMENVKQAPVPVVPEYRVVDVVLNNRHVGGEQNRIRRFSFGTPDGRRLEIEYHALEPATYRPCVTANGTQWDSRSARSARGLTDVRARSRSDRSARMLAHYIEWQGLPAHFLADAPFTVVGKVKAVGNGVPMTMGRAVARAVKRAVLAQVASRAPNR